jgi:uncharacterized protein (TIGR03000 family)
MLHDMRHLGLLLVLAGAAIWGTPAPAVAQSMGGATGPSAFGGGHGDTFGGSGMVGGYNSTNGLGGYGAYGTGGFYRGYSPYYGGRGLWGYGPGYYWGPVDGYYGYSSGSYYPFNGGLGTGSYASPGYPSAPIDRGIYGTILDPAFAGSRSSAVPARSVPAIVMVTVPTNAKVWFDDNPTMSTGTVRQYNTPPLQPGGSYTYTIRATWDVDGKPVSQTQAATVTPGESVRVVFPATTATRAN